MVPDWAAISVPFVCKQEELGEPAWPALEWVGRAWREGLVPVHSLEFHSYLAAMIHLIVESTVRERINGSQNNPEKHVQQSHSLLSPLLQSRLQKLSVQSLEGRGRLGDRVRMLTALVL